MVVLVTFIGVSVEITLCLVVVEENVPEIQ